MGGATRLLKGVMVMKKEDALNVLRLLRNHKWEECNRYKEEGNHEKAHDKAVEANAIEEVMRVFMDDAYAHSVRNALIRR